MTDPIIAQQFRLKHDTDRGDGVGWTDAKAAAFADEVTAKLHQRIANDEQLMAIMRDEIEQLKKTNPEFGWRAREKGLGEQSDMKATGTYACPFCGKDTPHSHETRLAYALPHLFQSLHNYSKLFLHLAALYSNDPELRNGRFSPSAQMEALASSIADAKAAYQTEMHQPLTPLEGMNYETENIL